MFSLLSSQQLSHNSPHFTEKPSLRGSNKFKISQPGSGRLVRPWVHWSQKPKFATMAQPRLLLSTGSSHATPGDTAQRCLWP